MNKNNNTRLNIGIVTKHFYPVQGGIENSILNIHKYFSYENFQINIYTSTPEKNITTPESNLAEIFKVYNHKLFAITPVLSVFKNDLIILENFNILPHGIILIITSILKVLGIKKFKLILVPHGGTTPNWDKFNTIIKFLKKAYTNIIGFWLIKYSCDHVIAVSEWEKFQLETLGINKTKISIIQNPTEIEAFLPLDIDTIESDFRETVKSYGKYAIQIGKIYPTKRYELSINALTKTTDLNLVILGQVINSEYLDKIKELIKQNNLEERVFLITNQISKKHKYYLIACAKMQLHTAEWENFGSVIYEGMSQKLIQIVTNTGNLPYLIKDGINGFVTNSSSQEIANKIDYIVKQIDNETERKIGETNKEKAQETQEEYVAQRVIKLYSEVMEHKYD